MMRPGHWLGSVFCVSFSALTLMVWWWKRYKKPVLLISRGSLRKQVEDKGISSISSSSINSKKGKGFPYSLPSVGPGADPGVQTVSPQVTISHPPGGRLPLLSIRPAVTFPARASPPLDRYQVILLGDRHKCEQLAQRCYAALPRVGIEPTTQWSQVQHSTRCATVPQK